MILLKVSDTMHKNQGIGRIHAMLGDTFYHIRTSENTLVRLFRTILFDRQIGVSNWSVLMARYADKNKGSMRSGTTDGSSDKSNLTKLLGSNKMTWNNFHQALCFLNIKAYRITITMDWKDGSSSEHSQKVTVSEENKFSFIKSKEDDYEI